MKEEKQQIANRIAEIISTARKSHGYSCYEIAKRTGINTSQIMRIESGNNIPNTETLIKICSALAIQIKLPDLIRI